MIYYRTENSTKTWYELSDEFRDLEKLSAWALAKLKEDEYLDSDSFYMVYLEFDIDGTRYYARAEFNGMAGDAEYAGCLSSYDFGSQGNSDGDFRKCIRSPYSPTRSYLHFSNNPVNWPIQL